MLRILRKVRQNLFGELGTRKYLLYAAGEVILIVIGVLLALQLNNWNNFRILRFQEKQILVRLSGELDQSMQRLSTMRRMVQRKESALKQVEPFLNGKPVANNEQFLKGVLVAASFGWEQPKLERITFDEIVGSGKFGLIRDTELRLSLSRFFHLIEQREHRSIVRITDFPNITYKLLPRGDSEITLQEGLSEERLQSMVDAILASDLRELLIPERNRAKFMLSIWDEIEEQAKALEKQILEVRGVKGVMADIEQRSERREAARNERNAESATEGPTRLSNPEQ